MVIWISGLSGSGKSYLANQIINKIHKHKFVNLDGDNVRKSFKINNLNLGYTLSDRKIQIKRLKSVAKILEDQNLNIVISAVYITNSIILSNRKLFEKYFHIHFDSDIIQLKKINNKKIYSKKNVYGSDIKKLDIKLSDITFYDFLNKDQINNLINLIKIKL